MNVKLAQSKYLQAAGNIYNSNTKTNNDQKEKIDPFAYNHICDHPATYQVKKRPLKKEQWQSVTDMSGRGFTANQSSLGGKKHVRNQSKINLDQDNRFFDDNKRIYETYGTLRRTYQGGYQEQSQEKQLTQSATYLPKPTFFHHIENEQVKQQQNYQQELMAQGGQQFYSKPTEEIIHAENNNSNHVAVNDPCLNQNINDQHIQQIEHIKTEATQISTHQAHQSLKKSIPKQKSPGKVVILKQQLNDLKKKSYTPKNYSKRPQSSKQQQTAKFNQQIQNNTNTKRSDNQQSAAIQDNNEWTLGKRNDLENALKESHKNNEVVSVNQEIPDSTLPQADEKSIQNRNNEIKAEENQQAISQQQQQTQSSRGFKKSGKQQKPDEENIWQSSYNSSYKPFKTEVYTVNFRDPQRKMVLGPFTAA
ncbi:UNKNOWN [Stylonychia lemnae]|uniref:Uncharacterized protein n=1 Tax=Stylonychia lemnae TaxID=5949 RepID=A0A078AHQ2_STYLE|nr:UNKNOWN [Stylonychia lemnae]|eukprot:CDW81784.1 UNKNOWN [Stylonychia lemnae]